MAPMIEKTSSTIQPTAEMIQPMTGIAETTLTRIQPTQTARAWIA